MTGYRSPIRIPFLGGLDLRTGRNLAPGGGRSMWWGSRDYVRSLVFGRSKTSKTKHLQNIGSFLFVKCKFWCLYFIYSFIVLLFFFLGLPTTTVTLSVQPSAEFFFFPPQGGEAKVGSPVEENLGTWGPAKRLDSCSKLEYRVHIDLNIYMWYVYIYIYKWHIYNYIYIDTCTFLSNTFASNIFGTCRCQVGRLASQARVA